MSQNKIRPFAELAAQYQAVRVSATCWLNKNRANAKGLSPISLRVTVAGVRIEVSTGIRLAPEAWDVKRGIVLGKGKLAIMQNEQLELSKAHVFELVNLMKAAGRKITARTLRRQMKAPSVGKPVCFIELCQHQISGFYEAGNQATLDQKRVCLKALVDWNGRNAEGQPLPLPLEDFEPDKASQFYNWLLQVRKVKVNTANIIVSGLVTLFNYAVKMGEAEVGENPFRLLKKKAKELSPRFRLNLEELARMREVKLSGKAAVARDIYLAQYYLHGSRVGVVLMLRWQDVANGRVNFKAEKGGPHKSIAIAPELERVLARYQPLVANPGALIFPLLPAKFHSLIPHKQFKARNSAITRLNEALKLVAEAIGVEGPLHSHTARHTLALHAVAVGGLAVAQSMLGHSSQKQTEVYVGQMRSDVLEAAQALLYGGTSPQPTSPSASALPPAATTDWRRPAPVTSHDEPAPSPGGRVVPMWGAASDTRREVASA